MDPEKKAKLGQRWVCYGCGGKFYDLNKPEPICPRCQADQRESPVVEEAKRSRKATRKKARKTTRKAKRRPALIEEEESETEIPRPENSDEVKELDLEATDKLPDLPSEDD